MSADFQYPPIVSISLLVVLICGVTPAHAAVVTVGAGAGYDFATLSSAIGAAQANDTINIAAGFYVNDFATINVPLIIQATGGIAVLDANIPIPNGKAILITNADVTIKNIEFRGAAVADANGAGIRVQAGNLIVDGSIFRDNQNGILAAPAAATTVTISNSTFDNNGQSGDGTTHGVYVGAIDALIISGSTFSGTIVGHDIKSRAANTIITDNILDDGVSGTTSYAIDISNGGVATISGNTITQGVNTQNPAMIAYAPEGGTYAINSLFVANNIFVNFLLSGSVGVFNHSEVSALLQDNTFVNVTSPLLGPGEIVNNNSTSVPEPTTLSLMGLALIVFVLSRLSKGTYRRYRS